MVIKLTAIRNLDNGPYFILMFALIVPLYAVASKLNLDVCSNAPLHGPLFIKVCFKP